MFEQDVAISTKHGSMPAFCVCPSASGAWPVVVVFMDAPGIRDELYLHARRIARAGYFCILPDMYYRLGTLRFDTKRRDAAMSAVIRPVMESLTAPLVDDDMGGILVFADSQEQARPGPVGLLGHCAGGRHVLTAAARFANRVAAVASLYGHDLVLGERDTSHLCLGDIRAELYCGFGGRDASTPPDLVATFAEALDAAKIPHRTETHADGGHGYMFAERFRADLPGQPAYSAYSPIAAEDTWDRLFDLWERRLGQVD